MRNCPRAGLIDLEVLSYNHPAVELYLRSGFATIARVADMARIANARATRSAT
jgi:ribosomal protein S18 acetylase RimI-like enzyme